MKKDKTPERWANDLTLMMTQVLGQDRFPVDVAKLATEYSQQIFPSDPITKVVSRPFNGFEGALIPRGDGSKEWGIGYSSSIKSPGRANFTLAHEFGHYLLHRERYPDGLRCTAEQMGQWDSEYNRVESEANKFAAGLLMPLDDFRANVPPKSKTDFQQLGECAERYQVSLMAATLRWLSYTQRRALLVVSREGFILWARSSEPALKSGAYIKVSGLSAKPIPGVSPIINRSGTVGLVDVVEHDAGVWLGEPTSEHAMISERFDLGLSLLMLSSSEPIAEILEEDVPDVVDNLKF
jgi:hypothetical protein